MRDRSGINNNTNDQSVNDQKVPLVKTVNMFKNSSAFPRSFKAVWAAGAHAISK